MRLIDADRLRDELKTLPMMSNWGEAFVPSLINKQPTAYDIDKVVGCLEKASCYIEERRYRVKNRRPCIHGDLCRAIYKLTGRIYSIRCPYGCKFYEPVKITKKGDVE